MKRMSRWGFPILILLLSTGVIWFLHLFTMVDETMVYIDWTSYAKLNADDSEEPLDLTSYSDQTELAGTYRFTGTLPEGLPSGYLLFETAGASLSLSLNGVTLCEVSGTVAEGTDRMPQATIYLPENPSGEIVMTCEILDGQNILFPPPLRFMPNTLSKMENFAYANRLALPTGAAALALILIVSIFLLSLRSGKADFTLLPLALAALGLMALPMVQGQGYDFLPDSLYVLLGNRLISLLTPIALLVYLLTNRRRRFWRYFLFAALWSGGALLIAYLFSLFTNGRLATYLNSAIPSLLFLGLYEGPVYWLTLWLTLVCAFISAYGVAEAFSALIAKNHGLALKNQMILKDYSSIEQKLDAKSSLLHEWNHQLTALDCLYEKGDYGGIKDLLDQLKEKNASQIEKDFSINLTYNAILKEMSERAREADILLETEIHVPKELSVPEPDLCTLLMNMLENALEACAKVTPASLRRISFRSSVERGYLAIYCENTFQGEIHINKEGKLLSSKKDTDTHGFGLAQMSAIAQKYHSIVDIHYSEDGLFVVQTALRLPKSITPES